MAITSYANFSRFLYRLNYGQWLKPPWYDVSTSRQWSTTLFKLRPGANLLEIQSINLFQCHSASIYANITLAP